MSTRGHCMAASAPSQAMPVFFRYNRVMWTRSPQSLPGKSVALGLMFALALSSGGCEFLGIGTGKPPPLPESKSAAPKEWVPREPQVARRLPGFGLAGPQNEGAQFDPEPAAAVARPAASGGSGTLNGNPNGLTREALNSAIQGTMGSLVTCFSPSAQNPMVAVSFEADPAGRASLVRVNGAPPDAERCVRNIVQGMRFPRFEGNGVHVDLPLTFHQVGRNQPVAVPPSPSGEAKGPSGPPLYIEP
jgi:hypothetical protein